MRSACGAVSLKNIGHGQSASQRQQLAAKMLERRLAAFQRHLARLAVGRVRAVIQVKPCPDAAESVRMEQQVTSPAQQVVPAAQQREGREEASSWKISTTNRSVHDLKEFQVAESAVEEVGGPSRCKRKSLLEATATPEPAQDSQVPLPVKNVNFATAIRHDNRTQENAAESFLPRIYSEQRIWSPRNPSFHRKSLPVFERRTSVPPVLPSLLVTPRPRRLSVGMRKHQSMQAPPQPALEPAHHVQSVRTISESIVSFPASFNQSA